MGDLPVQAVDVGLVMKVLQPIWQTRTETASRVRGRIESVLDWATASGYRQGDNPARWRGHIENLLPKKSKVARVEHHRGAALWRIAGVYGRAAPARGYCRPRARIRDPDMQPDRRSHRRDDGLRSIWKAVYGRFPASRMKAGKEHRVPLSEAAMAILRAMAEIRTGEHVFPGNRTGLTLSQMAHAGGVAAHGPRRSYGARFSVELFDLGDRANELPD